MLVDLYDIPMMAFQWCLCCRVRCSMASTSVHSTVSRHSVHIDAFPSTLNSCCTCTSDTLLAARRRVRGRRHAQNRRHVGRVVGLGVLVSQALVVQNAARHLGRLFPFLDDYQHPSPLPFGPPSQLHTVYSNTSSGSSMSLSDSRPSFSFPSHCVFHQQQHDTPSSTASPSLFRTQFSQSAANSPSLASLTALLSSPQPKLQDPEEEDPFVQQPHRDSKQQLLDDDVLEIKQEPIDNEDPNNHEASDHNSSNQDAETATTPQAAKRPSYAAKARASEPQITEKKEEEEEILHEIDIPDRDEHGEHGGASSSPVMDDQNMSTFLDSVALELDDMI